MIIRDRVHGRIMVDDPVIQDLILSEPMQRLKHISQDGASHFVQPMRDVTRFEHSVGAWYLSKLYSRPIEEQIASLLHDTPHTAFSHVIDIVMGDADDAYHDKFINQVILSSEIPDILLKHHINIDRVLNKENFHLLENDLPDISVDRWDYFMRDGYMFGLLPREVIKLFLKSIKERDQCFYFEDVRAAGLFATLFISCTRLIWADPTSHGTYFVLAKALKLALDSGIVTAEDFFKTDDYVLAQLRAAKHAEIDALLDRLVPGNDFVYASEAEAEFYGRNKPRFVDPWVEHDGHMQRLSEIIPTLAYYFAEFKARYAHIGVKSVS